MWHLEHNTQTMTTLLCSLLLISSNTNSHSMILLCTLSIPVRGLYSCDVFHHCPSSVFRKLLVISFKNLNNGKVMTDQITAALLLTLQMLKFYSVVIPCNNSLVTLAVENHSINKTTSKHPYFTIMPWKSGQLFISQKC